MKEALLEKIGIVSGFLISIVGILLPWQMRNTYSRMLASLVRKAFRSEAFMNYVMRNLFSSESTLALYKSAYVRQKSL